MDVTQLKKLMSLSRQITTRSVWQGRGLKIRVLRIGLSIIWIERLDLPGAYRIFPWALEDMKGMTQVN